MSGLPGNATLPAGSGHSLPPDQLVTLRDLIAELEYMDPTVHGFAKARRAAGEEFELHKVQLEFRAWLPKKSVPVDVGRNSVKYTRTSAHKVERSVLLPWLRPRLLDPNNWNTVTKKNPSEQCRIDRDRFREERDDALAVAAGLSGENQAYREEIESLRDELATAYERIAELEGEDADTVNVSDVAAEDELKRVQGDLQHSRAEVELLKVELNRMRQELAKAQTATALGDGAAAAGSGTGTSAAAGAVRRSMRRGTAPAGRLEGIFASMSLAGSAAAASSSGAAAAKKAEPTPTEKAEALVKEEPEVKSGKDKSK